MNRLDCQLRTGLGTLLLAIMVAQTSSACLDFKGKTSVHERPRREGQACNRNIDCESPLVCVLEECRRPCNTHSDCDEATQHCDDGICWEGPNIECGDGILQSSEVCDDGRETLHCNSNCTLTVCGDGIQNFTAGEACDDGDADNTDNCLVECLHARCGDGFVHADDEACDDGDANSDDWAPDSHCNGSCDGLAPHCGDGVLDSEAGETCDEGAANLDTGTCKSDCTRQVCGDSFVGPDEDCDDGNGVLTDDCPDGILGTCQPASCGDGFVQDTVEGCDDGDGVLTDDCPDGPLGTCETASCGDGHIYVGVEDCDDGNLVLTDACPDGPTGSCEPARCGDSWKGPGEGCDDGNDVDDDACTNACRLPTCGDGIPQSGEDCDDGDDDNTDDCLDSCVSASCGDGFVHITDEDCDDSGQNTAACDSDCTAPVCGDGLLNLNANEVCDNGTDNSDLVPDRCRENCQPPGCGDLITDNGEGCDDGQDGDDCDGCLDDCTRFTNTCGDDLECAPEQCDDGQDGDDCNGCLDDCTVHTNTCGDGSLCAPEICDNGPANSDAWQPAGSTPCNTDCDGYTPFCGDTIINGPESCDDGGADPTDDCLDTCVSATCGDGVVWTGQEQCDDGGHNRDGWGLLPQCNTTCSDFAPFCGDGTTDTEEECDQGVANDDAGACTSICTSATCGDGRLRSSETCDFGIFNPVGWTCTEVCDGAAPRTIVVGESGSCALTYLGTVECWGLDAGPVPSGSFTSITSGPYGDSACVAADDGTVECWGGQPPVTLGGTAPYRDLAMAGGTVCAIDSLGDIVCTGGNVPPSGNFVRIDSNPDGFCALRTLGAIECWSSGSGVQYAPSGTYDDFAMGNYCICGLTAAGSLDCDGACAVATPAGTFHQVAVSDYFLCAIRAADSFPECWGDDSTGIVSDAPTEAVLEIAVGRWHACARLASDYSLVCWGSNNWGAADVPAPSPLAPTRCGNDIVEAGEGCDDAVVFNGQPNACNLDCTVPAGGMTLTFEDDFGVLDSAGIRVEGAIVIGGVAISTPWDVAWAAIRNNSDGLSFYTYDPGVAFTFGAPITHIEFDYFQDSAAAAQVVEVLVDGGFVETLAVTPDQINHFDRILSPAATEVRFRYLSGSSGDLWIDNLRWVP